MKKQLFISNNTIQIPAILWGNPGEKVIIAVHGDMSNKEDTVIELLAGKAISKGYCVLSFDLPEHGERKHDGYACNPPNCINDLEVVYSYAKSIGTEISLFACSLGAYLSLLALHERIIQKSFFLSPVVNMDHIIQNMMAGFDIGEEQLKNERRIPLPIGKTLDWDYYCYVRQHPVTFRWDSPIIILYGSKDIVSAKEEVELFTKKYHAQLTVLENAEHYFCSDEQLHSFRIWLDQNL